MQAGMPANFSNHSHSCPQKCIQSKRLKGSNYVELLTNKRRSRGLIDTGASISCLDCEFVQRIHLPISPNIKTKPFYVDDNVKRCQ